jgi:FkbM family methyltransferase
VNVAVQVANGSGADAPVSGLIYDVGAHEGQDTEFYLKKGFRVVAIECNPTLVTRLSQRFAKEIAEGRLTVVPFAISDSVGEIDFYVNGARSVWSTADPKFARRNEKLGAPSTKIKVPTRPFASILSEFGVPYYLKVDIEGSDMECLKALRSFVARPRYLSIESEQLSWQSLLNEFDLL